MGEWGFIGRTFCRLCQKQSDNTPRRDPGEYCELSCRLLKNHFHKKQKSRCSERLLHASRFGLANERFLLPANPSHMEDALVVLPKEEPRPHQGKSVLWAIAVFTSTMNKPPESTCAGTTARSSLRREDLCPGEDPVPKPLVRTASLQVFDLRASLTASKPWHKLLFNFLLFLPIP